LSSISNFAQKGEMKIVPTADPNTFKLYYVADIVSDVRVDIKNTDKESVFKRNIKDKKGFILPIDFTEFGTDVYTIELFTPFFTLTDTVDYMSFSDRIKTKFEWEILNERERIIITALESLEDDITVIINDESGRKIDKQQIAGNKFGMRVFDFKDTDSRKIEINIYYKGELIDAKNINKK